MTTKDDSTTKLLLLAVVQLNQAVTALTEKLATDPTATVQLTAIRTSLGVVDYCTVALAHQTGGSVVPGSGAAPDAELLAKATTWVTRGKRDEVAA